MNRRFGFSVWIVLLMAALLTAGEKTVKIGECSWYTEYNELAGVVAIAKKAQKPILAVFTAEWCKPCKKLKKGLFAGKEFQAVEKEAVLFLIEATSSLGKELAYKYILS